jgi:hypothetical protein
VVFLPSEFPDFYWISNGASRWLRSLPIVTVNYHDQNTKAPISAVAVIMDALAALQQADNEIWWPGIGAAGVKAKSSPATDSAVGCGL